MKMISNKPISEYAHAYIAKRLKDHSVQTVVDIGGVGKLNDRGFKVSNPNIRRGISGTDLPYKNNSFDASVSIAVLEHVDNQEKFLEEAIRVARKISIHWFPIGKYAQEIEELKRSLGHKHPCRIPREDKIMIFLNSGKYNYSMVSLMTCSEHLLLLVATYPEKLNVDALYDGIFKYHHKRYGVILEIEK